MAERPDELTGRRDAVVREAADLIVDGGLAAVTVRNIAARLGCSTTVITHHFADKDEVLLETYRHVNREAEAMRDRALGTDASSPLRSVEELLPVGEVQRRYWSVWLLFWSAALHHPGLAAEHALGLQRMFDRMKAWLLSRGFDADRAEGGAQTICNSLYGIAMQAIFDLDRWTEAHQRAEFRRATAAIGG